MIIWTVWDWGVMLREIVNFVVVPEETIFGRYSHRPPDSEEFKPTFYKYPGMAYEYRRTIKELSDRYLAWHIKKKVRDYQSYVLTPPKAKIIMESEYKFVLFSPTRKSQGEFRTIYFMEWADDKYSESKWDYKIAYLILTRDYNERYLRAVFVGPDIDNPKKKYWLYGEKLFWENDGLEPDEIKALTDAKEGKVRRKIEFAKGPSTANGKPSARFISDDVKVAVWRRDGGRCVKCGSNENLEFDHIIPVALGGSSTERNVQLLCERCNREKGADLK